MIPPAYQAAVRCSTGIGSRGWSGYRRLLRQIHSTFADDYDTLLKARNTARMQFAQNKFAFGHHLDHLLKKVDEGVEELRYHIAPAFDDGQGGATVRVTSEQTFHHKEGVTILTPGEAERIIKEQKEKEEAIARGERPRRRIKKTVCGGVKDI
eukprot:Sspe_Gene.107949::Locus_86970_Transcript_2_3_Confidence_0.400_Length_553::g.107949::m.107949